MEFNSTIKEASSSKSKLVFVKVPDGLEDLTVDNIRCELSGNLRNKTGFIDWVSPKIPKKNLKFIGYSHELSEEEIESIFASRQEFYQLCSYHVILYNFSAYTGKWAVLAVID
jgi:hypothetical protein